MTIEAIKEALDALEDLLYHDEEPDQRLGRAVYVLQEAVKEAEKQEPVAYRWKGELFTPSEIEMLDVDDAVPLYQNPQPVECMCGICKLGKWENDK
jgi:hypothetical protein